MNRLIFPFLILLSALLAACGKNPENGALDGQWQLMEMSLKAHPGDSEYATTEYKKDQRIYWRIQLEMLMIYSANGMANGHTNLTAGRLAHSGKQLKVTDTYIHFHDRDSLITDPNTDALVALGIHGNAEDFNIEQADGKRMVLTNENKRLVFRKF